MFESLGNVCIYNTVAESTTHELASSIIQNPVTLSVNTPKITFDLNQVVVFCSNDKEIFSKLCV